MKKAILILGAVIISICLTSTVYATDLNPYEQEIISAARGTFEHEGVKYVVKQKYINELINYLSDNGVDLTASEKDTVLQKAFSSVERGVEEGYMIPLQEEDIEEEDISSEEEETEEEDILPEAAQNENSNSSVTKGKDTDLEGTSPVVAIAKILDGKREKDLPKKIDTSTSDNLIIKNTGFNLSSTLLTLIGIGVLMIAGMLVTVKHNFFAHQNE